MLHRSIWYYTSKARDSTLLRRRMHEIAQVRVRYGYWRIFTLLRREGWPDNHKRVYRIYKEEGLNLRSKRPRRSRAAAHRLERIEFSTERRALLTSVGAWILSLISYLTVENSGH